MKERQEINLYRAFEAPIIASDRLTWRTFWLLNGVILLFFIFMYLYDLAHLHRQEKLKMQLTTNITVLEKKFNEIKNSYPPLFFSQDATQSSMQLEKQIADQEKILASLSSGVNFSQVLLSLARTTPEEVWLTNIGIAQGGLEVVFKGQSLSMSSLQIFMSNLLRDKIFQSYLLNIKNATSSEKDLPMGTLQFEITLAKKTK